MILIRISHHRLQHLSIAIGQGLALSFVEARSIKIKLERELVMQWIEHKAGIDGEIVFFRSFRIQYSEVLLLGKMGNGVEVQVSKQGLEQHCPSCIALDRGQGIMAKRQQFYLSHKCCFNQMEPGTML